MVTKSDALTKRQKRIIARIQALKTIPLIIIMLSLFFYQAEWFNSLQKIQISYDFSNYQIPTSSNHVSGVLVTQIPSPMENTFSFTQNNTFYQYIEDLVSYIDQGENFSTANITGAEQNVINTQTHFVGSFGSLTVLEFDALSTVGQIEYLLQYTISSAQQIYGAFLNGSLEEQFLQQFLMDVWRKLIDEFLPVSWNNPSYIFIANHGRLTIRDLNVHGTFRVNNTELSFIQYNTTQLQPSQNATLSLSLTQIITAFLEITFGALVSQTIQILLSKNYSALENFGTYFRAILLSITIETQLRISVRLGLLPTILDFHIDLSSFYQQRIEETVATLN